MAYRLSTGDQPVSHQIHRLFLAEIDSAIAHLTGVAAEDRDRGIHEARKNIKKIRALLRLVAGELGSRSFKRENHRFRDIGRKLSELRDAQAIIESFAALPADTLPKTLRTKLSRSLEAAKSKTYSCLNIEDVLESSIAALQHARPYLESFTIEAEGFSAIEPGLLNIYKRGRKALCAAQKTRTAETLHTLRKRVKDHWYHMRLIGEAKIAILDRRQDALRQVEAYLGESHNLHVLQQTLARTPTKKVLDALQVRESELGTQALMLADGLYERRARQLKRGLSELHTIWSKSHKQHRASISKPPGRENDAASPNAAIA